MNRSAVISPCGTYRYSLTREWTPGHQRMLFVMLNPSTADAEADDPTVRKCIHFARMYRCDSLEVVNLYAFRSTSPFLLPEATIAVGPENLEHWHSAAGRSTRIVAAWGKHGKWLEVERAKNVFREMECLGANGDGSPRHPLYLPKETPLAPWCRDGRRVANA